MKHRLKLSVPILTMMALLGAMLVASPPANAAGAALTATPSTGLHNGQAVAITGTGFPASSSGSAVQCANLSGVMGCDVNNVVPVTSDVSGNVTASITVHTGVIGMDGSSCVAGGTCYIAMQVGSGPSAGSAAAPITFAAAPKPIATKTTAKVLRAKHKITGKVTSATATGLVGMRVQLQRRVHGVWKVTARITTSKNGVYLSKRITRAGKYRAMTPAQKGYAASHSVAVVLR